MFDLVRRFGLFAVLVLASPAVAAEAVPAAAPDPEAALARYVARPEAAYGWKLVETSEAGGLTVHKLELTSQTWQGVVWTHALYVYEPPVVKFPRHVTLFVSGGSNGRPPGIEEQLVAVGLANLSGGRVALLKQVPNQPLLDGRREDDLITETWLRYLKTGDETWPLLFPMVKGAVKAMDAVHELGEKRGWPEPVEAFVIAGASKRGWTSWLTPAADKRVAATAPVVIDTLNFRKQMAYQVESWGRFSEQIDDYTSKGLVRATGDETPREAALRTMMDPYTYRGRLTLPKLIVNGTNDRYWAVDAAKNYWDDLRGPKNVLELPNAGHGLDAQIPAATAGIAALFRAVASGRTLPEVTWEFDEGDGRTLVVTSDPPARSARLWTATSATNDFRESRWTDAAMPGSAGRFAATVPTPDTGGLAAFGELRFVDTSIDPPLTYSLTTIVKRYDAAGRNAAGR